MWSGTEEAKLGNFEGESGRWVRRHCEKQGGHLPNSRPSDLRIITERPARTSTAPGEIQA